MYCYQCEGKVKAVRGVQKCEIAGCDKWAMIGTRFCERCSREKNICQRCGVSMEAARRRKEDSEKDGGLK